MKNSNINILRLTKNFLKDFVYLYNNPEFIKRKVNVINIKQINRYDEAKPTKKILMPLFELRVYENKDSKIFFKDGLNLSNNNEIFLYPNAVTMKSIYKSKFSLL